MECLIRLFNVIDDFNQEAFGIEIDFSLPSQRGIRIDYIQAGNLQQNAYVERFNRTVRYEWLAQYLFESVGEVQDFATRWLWNYNHERPNMAWGGFTPKQRLAMAA